MSCRQIRFPRPELMICLACSLLLAGCAAGTTPVAPTLPPRILELRQEQTEVPLYGKFEVVLTVERGASETSPAYDNPYDARQVELTVTFTDPAGREWVVPGFWDGEEAWRVRFTPSAEGEWSYRVVMRDRYGESEPRTGRFSCKGRIGSAPTEHHGWLQVGNRVNASYSPRYLVYHDGSPFYGIGHCNAFDLMSYGWDEKRGFTLFSTMASHGENMLVYWPIYSNPFFASRYDQYSVPDMKVIDLVVEDAARKGIYLVFTIWNHDLLRDESHPWSRTNMGDWATHNGFRELVDLRSFFTDDEAWAWQENLYRYIIARWGYSPAIGLWQTVSEIEGTNAGIYADSWHERVNDYFTAHDPYRHPTTASKAGDAWWPAGYAVMDVVQMHSYNSQNDAAGTGPLIARWTRRMWEAQAKPNFIGEFGTTNQRLHPELLHNGIWAALSAGAAATPMEWNDQGSWGRMTDEMYRHMSHLATFVSELPLAHLNPTPLNLDISTGHGNFGGWGLLSADGKLAIFWVQLMEPATENVQVTITELPPGEYLVRPFDTWEGVYLSTYRASADQTGRMTLTLPHFDEDIAVRLEMVEQ